MSLFTAQAASLGIALGGGGVLGTAHLGALQALQDNNIVPQHLAGTSVGALIAAQYAFGISPMEIKKSTQELSWWDISHFSFNKNGLMHNHAMADFLRDIIGEVDFADSPIPLAFVATDLANREKVILREGSVPDAAMISATIPGLYAPHQRGDQWLVDGGLVENLPVSPLQHEGVDFILGISINSANRHAVPEGIVETLMTAFDVAIDAHTYSKHSQVDYLLELDCSEFNRAKQTGVEELFALGYEVCSGQISAIELALQEAAPSFIDVASEKFKSYTS